MRRIVCLLLMNETLPLPRALPCFALLWVFPNRCIWGLVDGIRTVLSMQCWVQASVTSLKSRIHSISTRALTKVGHLLSITARAFRTESVVFQCSSVGSNEGHPGPKMNFNRIPTVLYRVVVRRSRKYRVSAQQSLRYSIDCGLMPGGRALPFRLIRSNVTLFMLHPSDL